MDLPKFTLSQIAHVNIRRASFSTVPRKFRERKLQIHEFQIAYLISFFASFLMIAIKMRNLKYICIYILDIFPINS